MHLLVFFSVFWVCWFVFVFGARLCVCVFVIIVDYGYLCLSMIAECRNADENRVAHGGNFFCVSKCRFAMAIVLWGCIDSGMKRNWQSLTIEWKGKRRTNEIEEPIAPSSRVSGWRMWDDVLMWWYKWILFNSMVSGKAEANHRASHAAAPSVNGEP